MLNKETKITFNNGLTIPQIGLGVWRAENGAETKNAVLWAIEAGYRSIDTASLYQNEESVGDAVKESGLPREELFLTTKIWNDQHREVRKAFMESLEKLQTDYVDLYLMHFPVPGRFINTWKILEELVREGYIRSIGLSNHHAHHVEELLLHAEILPVVNQIECHPYLTQKDMIAYNAAKDIVTECWAPISKGRSLEEPVITGLAAKYGKTPAQVVLRWHLQNGLVIIPKSVHNNRIKENIDLYDFALTKEELQQIDLLERNGRIGADPDLLEYPD